MGEADAEGTFRPTHRVGDTRMATYARPEAAAVLEAQLDPALEVRVLEQRPDGWAHVECSNGWTTWVDGRKLVGALVGRPAGTAHAATPRPSTVALPRSGGSSEAVPLALSVLGGALILVGAVTPWYRFPLGHTTSFHVPVRYLVLRTQGVTQPSAGALLLPAVALVALGCVLLALGNRRAARVPLLVGAAIATNLALFGFMRWLHPATGLGISIGIPLTVSGGVLVVIAHVQTRDRRKEGPWALL